MIRFVSLSKQSIRFKLLLNKGHDSLANGNLHFEFLRFIFTCRHNKRSTKYCTGFVINHSDTIFTI